MPIYNVQIRRRHHKGRDIKKCEPGCNIKKGESGGKKRKIGTKTKKTQSIAIGRRTENNKPMRENRRNNHRIEELGEIPMNTGRKETNMEKPHERPKQESTQ